MECQFSLTPAKININVQVIWCLWERNSEIIADCNQQRRSSPLKGAQVQFITVGLSLTMTTETITRGLRSCDDSVDVFKTQSV